MRTKSTGKEKLIIGEKLQLEINANIEYCSIEYCLDDNQQFDLPIGSIPSSDAESTNRSIRLLSDDDVNITDVDTSLSYHYPKFYCDHENVLIHGQVASMLGLGQLIRAL